MKKMAGTICIILSILLVSACSTTFDIEKLNSFGTDQFDRQKWLTGNEIERGRMIYDFLKDNSPITDKTSDFIFENLGSNTGYYLYDHFPAYYLGPKPPRSDSRAWLLAFVIDHDTSKVKNIYVYPDL